MGKKIKEFSKEYFALLKKHNISFETIDELNNVLKDTFKEAIEKAFEIEMSDHLGFEKYELNNSDNERNGHSVKKVRGMFGDTKINIPRDRKSDFEPKIVKKYQKDISDIEQKIINLYGIGNSTRDIVRIIKDIYGFDLNPNFISKITDKLLPIINEFKTKKVNKTYSMVFIDGIRFKTREEGISKEQSVYIVMGYSLEGIKEIIGFYIGETESSKYWLTVFNDLKARGLERILMIASDNLKGISQSIKAAYPNAIIQKCVVHQIRNSMKFVNYKDKKEFVQDMKKIYTASSIENAEIALSNFETKWESKYGYATKSWRNNFEELVSFFQFPNEIRKLIYTTNVIESFNQKLRKVTKNKSFPNNNSLSKIIYLSIQKQQEKWNKPIANWGQILNQLVIFFDLEI